MPIPVEQLTDFDYDILRYLNTHSPCKKDVLAQRFSRLPGYSSRLRKLLSADQHPSGLYPLPDTSYIVEDYEVYRNENGVSRHRSKDTYSITELGKSSLQDHLLFKRKHAKRTAWFVAGWIVTTLIALLGAITGVLSLIMRDRDIP